MLETLDLFYATLNIQFMFSGRRELTERRELFPNVDFI